MGGGTKQKKLSKNAKRRLREKKQKEERRRLEEEAKRNKEKGNGVAANDKQLALPETDTKVEVLYTSADMSSEFEKNEAFQVFEKIFDKFATPDELAKADADAKENSADGDLEKANQAAKEKKEETAVAKPMSKKKKRLANRLSVAELKQLVKRPDVVEVHDVTAADPRLLVYLKSYRNTVAVPRHWSLKRKYLQGKRGVEKPPFELPECIKLTGIDKVREAFQEKESAMNNKAKARANMTGATGKIEIDYQVLYNAFFKFKTKPRNLTSHGDLYYESKEFETKFKDHKPGHLSDTLRRALGMPTKASLEDGEVSAKAAAAAELHPPPWLINMQRYGPPPDYPKLKIPGLNAPIPQGAKFGYNPGEWGKPPVDEFGQPLYGNVFDDNMAAAPGDVDTKARWGELVDDEDEESEEEESEEESEEEEEDEDVAAGIATPDLVSGVTSVTSGMETPATIDLRKGHSSVSSVGTETPQALYQVISEAKAKVGSSDVFGSSHRYDIAGAKAGKAGGGGGGSGSGGGGGNKQAVGEVNVAIDPSELEDGGLSKAALKQKYESADGATIGKAALDALTGGKKRKYPRSDGAAGKKKQSKSDFKF